MTESHSTAGTAAGEAGDAMQNLLLGFANQMDQLAGLISGTGVPALDATPIPGLIGEVSGLFSELSDLVARLLAGLIAILEAVVDMLRGDGGSAGAASTKFEPISVNITPMGR
ncbi:hypothetical protein [Gordonia sp. (in: high G+C Gram-positive bacteria)]|uniref:hypothetical protein n=1 Tax=Gordonia sp. (in: high G+C Gram-positive bacteria) TaxID=84139 RepID=UPI003C73D71C